MKTLPLAFTLALLATTGLRAETLSFPSDDPVATITIPDSWEPSETDTGIEAQSEDAAVYLSIDVADEKTSDKIVSDAIDFLSNNGVEIDASTQEVADGDINGMALKTITWSGKDKDGPVTAQLAFVSPSDGKLLVFTYWGTKGAEKAHSSEIDRMVNTLKPA